MVCAEMLNTIILSHVFSMSYKLFYFFVVEYKTRLHNLEASECEFIINNVLKNSTIIFILHVIFLLNV